MKKILIPFFFLISYACYPQEGIVFSGVVLDREVLEPIQGTVILNTTSGGGSVSDSLGFFSIEANPGDTLTFTDVRYKQSDFIIPRILDKNYYGIVQFMKGKAIMLEAVTIYPFPTEEQFKEAFMKLDPKPTLTTKSIHASKNLMKTIRQSYENDKYYYEAWADRRLYELTGEIPPNNLLDPFRWTEFIQGFKQNLQKK